MTARIQLGNRLKAVAGMVRHGSRLADVGTDHAYLPAYLIQKGTCPFAIAADIRVGPVASAKRTVEECGLTAQIDVRLGDGLSPIRVGEAEDIVIAGMGGETIADILSEASWIRDPAVHLILQPMSKPERLRRFLMEQGFAIAEEDVAEEDGRLYTVLRVHYTGTPFIPTMAACYLGRIPHSAAGRAYIQKHRGRLLDRAAGLAHTAHNPKEIEELRKAAEEMGDWLDDR